MRYLYLVSEFITVLLDDWCWNCSGWVSEGAPTGGLVNAGAFLVLLVKHAVAFVPIGSSTCLDALRLMKKMRRNIQLENDK